MYTLVMKSPRKKASDVIKEKIAAEEKDAQDSASVDAPTDWFRITIFSS